MYEAYSDYLQGISDSIGGLEAELKQRTFAASEVSNSIAKKCKKK